MQISRRTKFSLIRLLGVIEHTDVYVIFGKYNLNPQAASSVAGISSEIIGVHESVLSDLVIEVVQSNKTLRSQTSPRYKFDEQYYIFQKSLLLDGYGVVGNEISALDPNFEGHEPIEDELLKEVDSSILSNKASIAQAVKASAEDFIKAQPDYNGSLTNMRIALETIIREIATINGFINTRSSGNTWGPSLSHLTTYGFLDMKEEKALASIFTFISNGAHIPLGFSHEEFVRLGRNMCSSMCYFVMKKLNA